MRIEEGSVEHMEQDDTVLVYSITEPCYLVKLGSVSVRSRSRNRVFLSIL